MSAAARLTPRWVGAIRFIAPDLRGYAESDKPYADYMPATIAQDVLELADAERTDRFHILSHDLGGPPAVALTVAVAAFDLTAGRDEGARAVTARSSARHRFSSTSCLIDDQLYGA